MKRLMLIAVVAVLANGCTDSKTTTRVLTEQGYTEIEVGGYDAFACSDDDTFATKFTAKGPSGKRVSGVVCSDWLKGSTVRFH